MKPIATTSLDTTWQTATPCDLIDHILTTHHRYLYEELPRLGLLAEKVANHHGSHNPHLLTLRDLVFKIGSDLISHIEKETTSLFPALKTSATGKLAQGYAYKMPLQVAVYEHHLTSQDLDQLAALTNNFTVTSQMCGSYQALYHGLKELNDSVRLHIHKEDQLLFPCVNVL